MTDENNTPDLRELIEHLRALIEEPEKTDLSYYAIEAARDAVVSGIKQYASKYAFNSIAFGMLSQLGGEDVIHYLTEHVELTPSRRERLQRYLDGERDDDEEEEDEESGDV